jgi:histidinol-phosphatase
MSGASLATLLEFAVEVAWRAGRVTLAHFQTGVTAETKADRSPVTVADRAAEALCRALIEARWPLDGILGEETGESRAGAERRWVIDPIDGTRSFVHGVPLYSVLLALEERGEPLLGVIHLPALGETVWAARGLGCWWDGRRALVSPVDRLENATVLTSEGTFPDEPSAAAWHRLAGRAANARTWGDGYGYALVATGRAEAMLDPHFSPWDAAPLRPIIEEAGGVFTDWTGAATHRGGSGIATNAALARPVRQLVRGEP